jgi:SAM-dependent methyltransferase
MEIGFGNGGSLLAAAKLGMPAYGSDLDEHNVGDVKRRAEEMGLKVNLQCKDANEYIDRGETFDLIRASHLIEHLVDPAQFVDSITKLLSPKGFLFLECPNNSATFLRIKNQLRSACQRMDFYNSMRIMEHLWGFNRVSMRRMLERRGYRVLFVTDYPVCHRNFQPETQLWYPTVGRGIRESFEKKQIYPILKASIPLFDQAVSLAFSGGIGLATLAQRS